MRIQQKGRSDMDIDVTDMYTMGAVNCRPHVVILGAGASCAAIPNGDKYGRKIPVMKGFLNDLHMDELLDGVSLRTSSDNIEDIYSELSERPECASIVKELEAAIVREMSNFHIPDDPTVYDYLLLSLREKDLIASFNWDPLLLQAYKRVSSITTNLPELCFLHGNVAEGHSVCGHRCVGRTDSVCSKCGESFAPVRLLYPVKHKNYVSDWWIKGHWDIVVHYMQNAGALTIFGYSAPKSDLEAINLLKQGWGKPEEKPIQQTEIIDLKGASEVEEIWSDFIYNGHSDVHKSFFESKLALYPRRTVEADIECLICNKFISSKNSHFTERMSFEQIEDHLGPLLRQEEESGPR